MTANDCPTIDWEKWLDDQVQRINTHYSVSDERWHHLMKNVVNCALIGMEMGKGEQV
jgi:hypothetical protein